MPDTTQFVGTGPVRESHRFDERRLARWLAQHVKDFSGPLTVQQFKGGQSNPTYKLLTPAAVYVLRRKPPGHLLSGAHAVDREARVLSALHGSAFPVAKVYALCTDESVIGTSFYIMEYIEGRIFWDAAVSNVSRIDRPRYFDAMVGALAQLHQIDFNAIGLGEYGRRGNYFERQLSRWSRQYFHDRVATGADPNLDRLIEWLVGNIPGEDETTLVHGDFRIDNLIFHPTEPRVLAVLDWELSTLGHPLADFAYHLMMYRLPAHTLGGLADADLRSLNIPTEEEYSAAYCALTGRSGIPNLDFFLAFNLFRLAAIFHGIRSRLARGAASSAHAVDYASRVEWIAELGWAQACRARGGA